MGGPPRHDWAAIREEFVKASPPVTKEALAKKYGAMRSTVATKATQEKWDEQRRQYQDELTTLTRKRTLTAEAEVRARQAKIGRDMQDLARGAMARHLVGKDANGERVALITEPQEVRRWMVEGAKLERDAVGIADEVRLLVAQGFSSRLDKLQQVLAPEAYAQVLDVLAEGDGESE